MTHNPTGARQFYKTIRELKPVEILDITLLILVIAAISISVILTLPDETNETPSTSDTTQAATL